MTSKILSKECIQRLIRDVKDVNKSPLHDNGIFYEHDEEDMLTGRILIIGQKDTPYFGGYYFFRIFYPADYPFNPPRVVFCTQGDKVRFNPNLYTNGKVCVSILNTWAGEQWSSCQTIRTVLLTLSTLFCNDPLLNEPGIGIYHRDQNNYNLIIAYKNIEIAFLKIINKTPAIFLNEFSCFDEVIRKQTVINLDAITKIVHEYIARFPNTLNCETRIYSLSYQLNFQALIDELNILSLVSSPSCVTVDT